MTRGKKIALGVGGGVLAVVIAAAAFGEDPATPQPANTPRPTATATSTPSAVVTTPPVPTTAPATTKTTTTAPPQQSVYYANCSEARAAGAAPLHRGDPGYRSGLDRDGDGVACE